KILDFGLAKQTRSSDSVDVDAPTATLLSTPGLVVGTMPYMSPEQVQGEPLDASSDIFSLGVTLYEMLAGKHPFKDKSAAATMSRILRDDPMPTERYQAQVSPELQTLLSQMLSKDKAARYQSAQDLLTDLRQLPAKLSANHAQADSTPTKLSPIAPKETLAKHIVSTVRRQKWAVLAAGLALVLLAVAIGRLVSTE